MTTQLSTAVTVTATKTVVGEACEISAIGITGGADAATVTLRDGGATGPVRWSLGVAAGVSDGIAFESPLRFKSDCHATVTGTTPNVHVAVRRPQANQ